MQSMDVTWYMGNSLLLDVVAPLYYYPDPAVPVIFVPTTIEAHLFDKEARSVTTQAELAAATTITLESVNGLADDDVLTVGMDDGTFERVTIAASGITGKVVTFSPGFTAACAKGARVWKTYGAAVVTGVLYGSAAVDSTNWGYVWSFAPDYDSNLRRDLRLEAMAILIQAGIQYTRTWDVIMAEPYGNP